jgi:hypothetical protein
MPPSLRKRGNINLDERSDDSDQCAWQCACAGRLRLCAQHVPNSGMMHTDVIPMSYAGAILMLKKNRIKKRMQQMMGPLRRLARCAVELLRLAARCLLLDKVAHHGQV